jgi:hypothetical protein
MKTVFHVTWRGGALVLLYVVLFLAGTALFPVSAGQAPSPEEAAWSMEGILACAVIDTALLAAWVSRTRLRGWRRWLATAAAFYGVKTFTSQLEALWFMPNVTAGMAPSLLAMTLPLCLLFPLAVIAAFGIRGPVEGPAWRAPAVSRARAVLDWAVLSVLVYPALFWAAGYFVAHRNPAVREFYGGLQGDGFLSHLTGVFAADPTVVPFEAFRGFLWILMILPFLRTSAGRWWVDALLTGLFLALVQNDVHLIPNPLMSAEVRMVHLVETATSNFVWGLAIVWVLRGRHEVHRAVPVGPGVAPPWRNHGGTERPRCPPSVPLDTGQGTPPHRANLLDALLFLAITRPVRRRPLVRRGPLSACRHDTGDARPAPPPATYRPAGILPSPRLGVQSHPEAFMLPFLNLKPGEVPHP